MNPNVCESPEHSFPSSCVSEPSRNEINMKLTHAAWQLRPLQFQNLCTSPNPQGPELWPVGHRGASPGSELTCILSGHWCFPFYCYLNSRIYMFIHPMVAVSGIPGISGLSKEKLEPQGGCHMHRCHKMMLCDRLAYKGSPSQHRMVQRLSHSFTVCKTDSKWLSVFIWTMFKTTGCVNIWIWCSWTFELVSLNS